MYTMLCIDRHNTKQQMKHHFIILTTGSLCWDNSVVLLLGIGYYCAVFSGNQTLQITAKFHPWIYYCEQFLCCAQIEHIMSPIQQQSTNKL